MNEKNLKIDVEKNQPFLKKFFDRMAHFSTTTDHRVLTKVLLQNFVDTTVVLPAAYVSE